jgi:RNA 2',3'-cyclic 3'-phosphodiesterase
MRTNHSSEQPSFGPEFEIKPSRRLFFGIQPDAGATDSLTRLIEQLRNDDIMPGRPVEPDRLHVTLHHLGDFIDRMPPDLVPAAKAAAATVGTQPFDVAFDRVGGTRGPFLLRASDGSQAVRSFRKTLSVALIAAGLRRHVRSGFNPHVTLSYDFCDVPERQVDPIRWTVRQFVLIESLLGQRRHIELGRWSING